MPPPGLDERVGAGKISVTDLEPFALQEQSLYEVKGKETGPMLKR